LQFGGEPIKSGKQEHEGDCPLTWHWELGPQGEGTHGFSIGIVSWTAKKQFKKTII